MQSVLGRSLAYVKGWAAAELEPVYARARELCAQIRDPALAFRTLYLQWLMRCWKRELHDALELADELLAAAEGVKDPAMLLIGKTRAVLSFSSSASWSLRRNTWRRRWPFSTSGNPFPWSWRHRG